MKGIAVFLFWCMVAAACLKGCEFIEHLEVNSEVESEVGQAEGQG